MRRHAIARAAVAVHRGEPAGHVPIRGGEGGGQRDGVRCMVAPQPLSLGRALERFGIPQRYREDNWPLAVQQITGGEGVDVALEAVGPRHLGETISILAPFGRLISYGSLTGYDDTIDPAALARVLYNPAPAQTLTGFNVTHWLTQRPRPRSPQPGDY